MLLPGAARKLGLALSARKAGFLVQGADKVGAMTKLLDTLAAAKINIADLLNKSRGEYAYTLIDTDGTVGEEILNRIRGINGVLSARIV